MSTLAITDKIIAVTRELNLEIANNSFEIDSKIVKIVTKNKPQDDYIADLSISSNNECLAVITSASKELHVFSLPALTEVLVFTLPRSASRIRFTEDNKSILVADKSGDALIYRLENSIDAGEKILGHLSLLLDILQTKDEKFIITSDRDEKIRVSCNPNTYNIHSYCLGHKEFVNHLEMLPHNPEFLVSTSGDGTVKIWNHKLGQLSHNIDTSLDIEDSLSKQEFISSMDSEGMEVATLPIVHCGVAKDTQTSSIIAIVHYNSCEILLYSVEQKDAAFTHKIKGRVKLDKFPLDIKIDPNFIYVFDHSSSQVLKYCLSEPFELISKLNVFVGNDLKDVKNLTFNESIKQLYKRKFDNVQEYQERKRKRLNNK